ncbi:hypothetical protein BDA99DRAFT_99426 [Phascolomyces articulosus]|uniref:No apical meristem-associated C-terminal domain-containing protein n=1 Tax=Phascolomyces articulosus TaxID=60185 RepID=A0AAD5K743_9FUNG|nr:hypothetical protein BDA99DRAFT_99426 [Phascolomyces articulosus]
MIIRQKRSGENDEDQFKRTVNHYEENSASHYKGFLKFKECFDLLKEEEKWRVCTKSGDEPQEVDPNYKRPMGQQQAKVLKKKPSADNNDDAEMKKEQLVLVRNNMIHNAKKIKYLKSITESAQTMADHTILGVDMTTITPLQKAYYSRKQQLIFERIEREEEDDDDHSNEYDDEIVVLEEEA